MKRFMAGMIIAVAVIAGVVVVWLSLHDQTKGILIGVVIGFLGLVLGVVVALAVVGVLLLMKLHWGVNVPTSRATPPVVIMGGRWQDDHLALPPPGQGQPVQAPRAWQVLGGEDGQWE